MTRKFHIFLILMGLLSIILIGWSHEIAIVRDFEEIAVRLGEALFIAAFLAATVDRYVKYRLSREVARDVSPFIMGHGLPPEIQHEIREISIIEVYRTDLEIDYELVEIPGNDNFVFLKGSVKYRVHNLSDKWKSYPHILFVQKPHRPPRPIAQIPNAGARGILETKPLPFKRNIPTEYNIAGNLGEDDPTGFARRWQKDVWILH